MILAEALKQHFSDNEILSLYTNHCIMAGKGMVGLYDISMGLFGKEPKDLSTVQQLYLSRLVKWNRQVPNKIIHQVKVSLPTIAENNNWNNDSILVISKSLDTLTFKNPPIIETEHSQLLDLANEYWLKICQNNGFSKEELQEMDISKPNSLIRRKGNLTIKLAIDIRLQNLLESSVNQRGYGSDTTIYRDVRIGGLGKDIPYKKGVLYKDTLRQISVIKRDTSYTNYNGIVTKLKAGDTLVTNIRYKEKNKKTIRRSEFYYTRKKVKVPGQYYSYLILDSKSGQILAYYSRDKLGSKLTSLLKNRVPNGSSLAKPMIYALNYDIGNFKPYEMLNDSITFGDTVEWARDYLIAKEDTIGMIFKNVKEEDGYPVRNHDHKYQGYDYAFNHLAKSNNIVTVESMFRLNTIIDNNKSEKLENIKAILERIGAWDTIKRSGINRITGPRIWSEIVSYVYGGIDGKDNRDYISNDNYSYALGTLELSTLEQAYLFNSFYQGTLINKPATHPSLAILSVVLGNDTIEIKDSVKSVQLFNNIDNIRPVKLALFKRFTSNPADNFTRFDLCYSEKRRKLIPNTSPLVNFAKSGTTDDIIRPFNWDMTNNVKTNYGIWDGIFRVNLPEKELNNLDPNHSHFNNTVDITVISVGECNRKYTGLPYGKVLHAPITNTIMNTYGQRGCYPGFYTKYEEEIIADTPRDVLYPNEKKNFNTIFSSFFHKQLPNYDQLSYSKRRGKYKLTKDSYKKLLQLQDSMGVYSTKYKTIVKSMHRLKNISSCKIDIKMLEDVLGENNNSPTELETAIKALKKDINRY